MLDITRLILQSDYVISIRNSMVIFFILVISISAVLFVSGYIHTDTGACKVMVDRHFATIIKIIHAYVDT